jgi:hypothetical protein
MKSEKIPDPNKPLQLAHIGGWDPLYVSTKRDTFPPKAVLKIL